MLQCRFKFSDRLLILFTASLIVTVENIDDNNEVMTTSGEQCKAFQTGGLERMAEFASPGYPDKYFPNIDCIRVIHSPPNYDIVFRFHDVFRIETSYEDSLSSPRAISPNCPNDYLEIRDGSYSFSPLIGRFCGLEAPHDEIRVKSGYAWLNFHSDSLLEDKGFSAEYEFVRRSRSMQKNLKECRFSYVLQLDGYINVTALSDFYEDGRSTNQSLECVYQIRVPSWLRVAIFIEKFELAAPNQCAQNYLEIYAGSTSREPLKRYCGIIATHTYTSNPVVFVRMFVASKFHADNTHLRILFSSYLAQKNCSGNDLFECGDDICIPKSLACNARTNCLYRKDEINCYDYENFINTLLLNSPLILLPILVAGVLSILAFVYKPWLTHSISSQILEIEAKEGTPLTAYATTNQMTTVRINSQPVTNSRSTSKKHASMAAENGECRQNTAKTDVWQAIEDTELTVDDESSYISIDV